MTPLARQAAVLAAAAALVAAAGWAGLLPQWPGLAHLVAVPPLGLFADLRMLVPEATGYPTLIGGAGLALAARTVMLALLLGGLDRRRLGFALRFYLVALPLALVAALVMYAGHAALYSGLHWLAMGGTLVALVALASVPWTQAGALGPALLAAWRGGLRVWPLLAYLAALVALGGLAFPLGTTGWLGAVPVSAALTLVALRWLSQPAGPWPRLQLAGAGGVLAAATAAFLHAAEPWPGPTETARDGSLLAMSGMNSSSGTGAVLELDHPALFGYRCDQVYYASYAGPGGGQPQGDAVCPIRTGAPFDQLDTRRRRFDEQVELLAAQMEQIPAPVTLLAHSQGAWVAWEAAARGLLEHVETLVVIGPLPNNSLGWPPPTDAGPGRVGVDFIQLMRPVTATIFDFSPYEALARDVLQEANVPRGIYEQPVSDELRVLSVFGIGDLPLNPGGWRFEGAVDACPVIADHPDLPRAGGTQRQIQAFLDEEPLDPCPWWRTAVHPLSMAWTPPPAARAAAYEP